MVGERVVVVVGVGLEVANAPEVGRTNTQEDQDGAGDQDLPG